MKRLFILSVIITAFGCHTDGSNSSYSSNIVPPGKTPFGMAITPKNFPDHTMADVDEAFVLARQLADYSVFIYQRQSAYRRKPGSSSPSNGSGCALSM